MIGSGFKKLAQENGMTVSGGVAYGALRGFNVTFSEGSGYKLMVFSTNFPDPAKRTEFTDAVNSVGMKELYKQYRVQKFEVGPRLVQVLFYDNIGTMKKIRAFLDWFLPLLEQYGASHGNICAECGFEVTAGVWLQVDGVCHYLHEGCAQKVARDVESDNTRQREEDHGNYLTGTIGALLGAAIGAVLWAVVLNMGYVASLVGLVIGWLADKGYDLLKGRQGKGKVAILIVAVIFGVLLGTFSADAFTLMQMINAGELPGLVMADIPPFIVLMLTEDAEYLTATLSNIGMGLLFAGLGVFYMLRRTAKEVSDTSVRYMK